MKKFYLLAILAMILPGIASSTNYFKAGTQWTVNVGSDPSHTKQIVYTLVDAPVFETEDPETLKLVSINEEGEETLEAEILSEGEKVYFRNGETRWNLLYDFSLHPGDETVLFSGMYNPDSSDYPEFVNVKCEKVVNSFGNVDFEDGVFFLATYLPDQDYSYSRAIWYNGLGSVQGPLVNFENLVDGVIRNLVKVTCGDEVIFDYYGSVGINTIHDNQDTSAPSYRLDGRIDNGQPGIIISDGKKWIRK